MKTIRFALALLLLAGSAGLTACSGDSATGVTTTTTTTEQDLYVRVMTVSVNFGNSRMSMTFDTAAVSTDRYTNQRWVGSEPRRLILRKGQQANIGLQLNAPGWYFTGPAHYEVFSTWHPVDGQTHPGVTTDGTSRFIFRTYADTLKPGALDITRGGFTGTNSDYKFGAAPRGEFYVTSPEAVRNYTYPEQIRTVGCDADDSLVFQSEQILIHLVDKSGDFFYDLGNAPVTTVTCKLYTNIAAARAANPGINELQ